MGSPKETIIVEVDKTLSSDEFSKIEEELQGVLPEYNLVITNTGLDTISPDELEEFANGLLDKVADGK